MSKTYLETLDSERIKLLTQLHSFQDVGYLAGGTALALQIGHRQSIDFDIFVENTIDNKLRLKIGQTLSIASYIINTSDQITVTTTDNISVTFLWYYFKRIDNLIKTEYIPFASIKDITADKAMTIGRRAVWRDYVDLYFLLQQYNLQTIIEFARKKFKSEFIISQFLEQLSYFEDIAITPIAFVQASLQPDEIKSFLKEEVKRYVKINNL